MLIKIESSEWPEDKSHPYPKLDHPYPRLDGEVSGLCNKSNHKGCRGFKRYWFGPVVTPHLTERLWLPPARGYADIPCACTCHDLPGYKIRLYGKRE